MTRSRRRDRHSITTFGPQPSLGSITTAGGPGTVPAWLTVACRPMGCCRSRRPSEPAEAEPARQGLQRAEAWHRPKWVKPPLEQLARRHVRSQGMSYAGADVDSWPTRPRAMGTIQDSGDSD